MTPTGPLHPELLALGLSLGLAGGGWALVGRRRSADTGTAVARAVHASVAGAVLALAVTDLAPRLVLVALGVTLAAGVRPRWADGRVGPAADAVAVVLVAIELQRRAGPFLVLPLALGLLLAADRHGWAERRPAVSTAVAGLACAGLWAAAPDTEVVVVAGPLLAGSLAAGILAARTLSVWSPASPEAARRPPPAPWHAVWILLTWAAAYGYRGRPGGGGGALVALVAVAAWAVGERWRRNGDPPPLGRTVTALLGTLAVVMAAARTVGLDRALDRRPAVVAGLAIAAALLGLAGTLRRRPLPAPGDGDGDGDDGRYGPTRRR